MSDTPEVAGHDDVHALDQPDRVVGDVNSAEWLSARGARAAAMKHETMQARREAAANALPPLREIEDAFARLEKISELAISGVLPGAQAGAAVRAVESWLSAQRHLVSINRFRGLEVRIRELENELEAARSR